VPEFGRLDRGVTAAVFLPQRVKQGFDDGFDFGGKGHGISSLRKRQSKYPELQLPRIPEHEKLGKLFRRDS